MGFRRSTIGSSPAGRLSPVGRTGDFTADLPPGPLSHKGMVVPTDHARRVVGCNNEPDSALGQPDRHGFADVAHLGGEVGRFAVKVPPSAIIGVHIPALGAEGPNHPLGVLGQN